MITGTRKIKKDKQDAYIVDANYGIVNVGEQKIHPITLELIHAKDEPIILKQMYFNDNKNSLAYSKKASEISKKEMQSNFNAMLTPPAILETDTITKIYFDDINSPEQFENAIMTIVENDYNNYTINRMLKTWIRTNLSILKSHNKLLSKILIKLININFNNIKSEKFTSMKDFEKNVSGFVDYWLDDKTGNEFTLDIYNDLINNLTKKI